MNLDDELLIVLRGIVMISMVDDYDESKIFKIDKYLHDNDEAIKSLSISQEDAERFVKEHF